MSEYYNENRVTYVTPVKQLSHTQTAGPPARVSNFVQADARFYKETFREQKNIQQMRHSTTYDIIKHDQDHQASPQKTAHDYSPLKEIKGNGTAGKDVFSQSVSPCKKRLASGTGQASRMLETNFQMYPNAKDRCEALNPQVKRARPDQCQFIQSEIKAPAMSPEKVRPQTVANGGANAGSTSSAVFANPGSTKRTCGDVKNQELLGQTKLAHPEFRKKFVQMTRDERLSAVAAIHCSSQMTKIINQAKDKDVTSKLAAQTKQTSYATFKGGMQYPVTPVAQKAPPVWKNF